MGIDHRLDKPGLLLGVVLGGMLLGSDPAAGKTPIFTAATLVVESLRLGQPIAAFEEKYAATLCDRDPIDKKTRVIWFHAPKPCREAEPLPGKTILVLFTRTKSPQDALDAMAWFGDWPKLAGNFPAAVGIDREVAGRLLGTPKRMFDFARIVDGGKDIVVWRHPSGVYSLVRRGKVMGYVAGAMGNDPKREEWRGLVSSVLRYSR